MGPNELVEATGGGVGWELIWLVAVALLGGGWWLFGRRSGGKPTATERDLDATAVRARMQAEAVEDRRRREVAEMDRRGRDAAARTREAPPTPPADADGVKAGKRPRSRHADRLGLRK